MTFQFNGAITNITEWKMGLATPNGFTIEYAFNSGGFSSTGHSGSTCTEVDLTLPLHLLVILQPSNFVVEAVVWKYSHLYELLED